MSVLLAVDDASLTLLIIIFPICLIIIMPIYSSSYPVLVAIHTVLLDFPKYCLCLNFLKLLTIDNYYYLVC